METNVIVAVIIGVPTLIATIVGVYYAYRQWNNKKEEKPSIIEVKPTIEVKPEIHIDTSKKNDIETKKEVSSYKPLDNEFYANFGVECELAKRGNDIFSIKEE